MAGKLKLQLPRGITFSGDGTVSAGLGQRKGVECSNSASQAVSPFLVPLLELIDRAIAYVAPSEIPSAPEVIESYIQNTLSEEHAKCLLRMHGLTWDMVHPYILARRDKLTVAENIQLGRRRGVDDKEIEDSLRNYGWLRQVERAGRMELYDELPSVSDVLHFLQRNVFDQKYVDDFGLMDGYDERFKPRYEAGLRALGMQLQTIKDHYAAHWVNLSIGQLSEMVQRLRPGRVGADVQFTVPDFLRVLAEQDVAPYFRERLRQIAFRTVPLRQLTQLVISREIDHAELANRWQDIGFKAADAEMLATALEYQAARQRATQQRGWTAAAVARLWPAKKITREEAYANLAPQGMTHDDVDTLLEVAQRTWEARQYETKTLSSLKDYASTAVKAYTDGDVSADDAVQALVNAGYPPDAAQVEIQTASLKIKMQRIAEARKAVQRAFLRGEVDGGQAVNALVIAGVLPGPAQDYVQRWSLLLTVPRKAATRAMINRWAFDGLISIANAEQRLLNLGYSPDTIALDMAELALTIQQAQQRAAALKAAELAKAEAATARANALIMKQYCRLYTPSKMKLWYAERVIDEETFRDRLAKCGYTAESIELAFREAEVARAARDERAAKVGANGVEYTGPGADAG